MGALAAILTVLLFQATLVGPVSGPYAVSLPAVLVAAIALVDGPAPGMSFGFAAGLVADLGSRHPAGILALSWLLVGLACGAIGARPRVRRDAVTAGIVAGLATALSGVFLVIVHDGEQLRQVITGTLPVICIDALLAVPVVALVRAMLRTDALRAPHPVFTELAVGARRG